MKIPYLSWRGRLLRALLRHRRAIVERVATPDARADLAVVAETRRLAPLLVGDGAALHIMACVRATAPLGGAMAEAGVLAGGTARLICSAKGAAPLHLFDTFETLQAGAAGARGAELRRHFGTLHVPQREAERLLAPYGNVRFHPGIFPDTAAGLEDERFSFVHLDLDLAPSTADALAFFGPRMLPGGIILGDDYEDPAVRGIFEGYFAGSGDTLVGMPWGQGMVVSGGPETRPRG
jgi:O-methyltransferase